MRKFFDYTSSSTVEGTRKGRLQKRWIDVVKKLIRVRDISDGDVRRMNGYQMKGKHFVYGGDMSRDTGLTF